MGFKFSLNSVLEWRSDNEEAAKLKVVEAQQALNKEETYLQSLIIENIRLKEKSALTGKLEVMRQEDLYKKVLNEKIIQQKLVVEKKEAELEETNESLLEAHKDRKVLEKLEEKEQANYTLAIDQAEQEQLDEFATLTFGRSMFD